MLAMPNAMPYQNRQFFLCIDEYNKGEPAGRLYSGVSQKTFRFQALLPLLRELDCTLDRESPAERFDTYRSFNPAGQVKAGEWREVSHTPGRVATIVVRVHFRQNATWQGEAVWIEEKKTCCFRSALELLFLIDSAIQKQDEHEELSGS